ETHHRMSLANQKATTEYQEAIQATQDIESQLVGFAKTSDYKRGLAIQLNVVIKQNNILLYLTIKQSQKLIELEEKLNKLQQEVHIVIEQEPTNLENLISSIAKRLDNFSISGIKEMTSRRPNIINRSSTQTEILTQEDQIRGYRAMTIGRYQAARATRRVFGRNNYNLTLESAVDPKRQVELLRERLHALHQRSAGTKALVVLRDTRWEDSRQIIGTLEVDLFAGTQLVYMLLDMVLSIDDFHNHVEVVIQTHGYDTWQGGMSE
ncbi:hypothetical protein Tco_0036155, partial [Tanacetum coccineum]